MTPRLRNMSDEQLGTALGGLGDRLAWPETPDVAAAVRRSIAERQTGTDAVTVGSRRRRRRLVLAIAIAVLMLAAAATAAKLVIDLGAVSIRIDPNPSTGPSARFDPAALGRPASLAEAERLIGRPLGVPVALGPPDVLWVDRARAYAAATHGTPVVAMAWAPRDGLPPVPGTSWGAVLIRFEGEAAFAQKLLPPGGIDLVEVFGDTAYVIEAPHELRLLAGDRVRSFLVRGNVLLWQEGPIAWRLETALPQASAVRIAETLRA
jgi:hypothetical protein